MTQQLVLKPLGIITQPNRLGTIPQGALSLADSCYMRQPGMIENAYGYTQVSPGSIFANGTGPAFIVPTDSKYAYYSYFNAGGTRFWAYVDFTNTSGWPFGGESDFHDEAGNTQLIDVTGRYGTTINRNRLLVTASLGTFVYDIPTHSSTRSAGLPQVAVENPNVSGVGSALPSNTHAMYTALLIRRFSDGYELVSVPALAKEVQNETGTTQNVNFTIDAVAAANEGYMKAGDIVQVFRTKSQTYNTSTSTYTNTGSDFLLALEYTLTSADITAGGVVLVDAVPDQSLGEALYTNAGVKTQDGAAFPSPTAKVVCTFKGYTFYLNRIDPPKFTMRASVWWGYMGNGATGVDASTRANGIGTRDVRGNSTTGNNTLTSVPAADIVGIVIGQVVNGTTASSFSNGSVVTAVGASTVTFDRTAVGTATTVTLSMVDRIQINGTFVTMPDYTNLPALLVATSANFCLFNLNLILPQGNAGSTVVSPDAVPATGVDLTFTRLSAVDSSFTLRATNGHNYTPTLPRVESSETATTFSTKPVTNGLSWSEQNQPENVPPLNTAFCGSGEIYAAYATRDAVWIFASDGLWRLSGTGGSAGAEGFDWRIDPVDSTLIISGPQAGCVLRDMVFAYTNRGLVQIGSDGTIKELTLGRIDDRLPGPAWSVPSWTPSTAVFMVADETNDEILLKETSAAANRYWIYNYINDAFTQDVVTSFGSSSGDAIITACYSRYLQAPVFFDTATNYLISPNNPTSRRACSFKFQPLLGDDPFTLRMWQQVELSVQLPSSLPTVNFNLTVNGDVALGTGGVVNGVSAGTRALAQPATSQIEGKWSRASWSIPRNAPAIAYTLGLYFTVTGFSGSGPILIQGLAAKFVDLTEQRSAR